MGPVIIKLLTLWMLDESHTPSDRVSPLHNNWISHGIWETKGVEEKVDATGKPYRLYDLVCIVSYHKDRKVGDKCRMTEEQIIWLCHEVKIVHQPKVNKRDVIINTILEK